MKKKSIFIIIVIAIMSFPVMGQFKLSGEFRPRTEYSHGYGTLADVNQKSSLFTSQRTRLNFDYKAPGITTKLVLQDVRNWGSQSQLVGNEHYGVSVHEAWAEAGLGDNFMVRLGRQELVYDNQRIFGNVGWAQQGRSHDLALLKYKGKVDVHLGVAYNESGQRNNNLYFGPDAYKFMQFLWLNHNLGLTKISILALNNGVAKNILNDNGDVSSQEIIFTQTLGPNVEFKHNSLTVSANAYYQMGKLVNGTDLSAFEYLAQIDLKATDKLSLGVSYEVLSGTNTDTDDPGSRSFTPLYGTNHKFNGHMDYFFVGNHGGSVGLKDLTGSISYLAGKVKLACDVHGFWSFAPIPNTIESYLGTEFDLSANIPINEAVSFTAGYSHMMATEVMEILKGGNASEIQNWAWLMFTFKPNLYN